MARILMMRKPTGAEFRRLNELIEEAPTPRQRQRAHVVVLYATGMNARDIAVALGVHANTVYAVLQAFGQRGMASIQEASPRGAPARIDARQVAEIRRIAELDPVDRGEPYGHWSLATLRTPLLRHHIVRDSSNDPDAPATRRRINAYLRGRHRRADRWIQISYLPDTHKHQLTNTHIIYWTVRLTCSLRVDPVFLVQKPGFPGNIRMGGSGKRSLRSLPMVLSPSHRQGLRKASGLAAATHPDCSPVLNQAGNRAVPERAPWLVPRDPWGRFIPAAECPKNMLAIPDPGGIMGQ